MSMAKRSRKNDTGEGILKGIMVHAVAWSIILILLLAAIQLYYQDVTWENFEDTDNSTEIIKVYTNEPYKAIENHDKILTLNNEGFRGNDIDEKKEHPRIVFIGDSFTFGYGIQEEKDTFPQVFGSIKGQRGVSYEIINRAVPGSNFLDAYWILRNKVSSLKPDIIIYPVYQNDLVFERQNIPFRYCSLLMGEEKIQGGRHLLWMVDIFWRRINNVPEDYYSDGYFGWRCFGEALEDGKRISEENGARLLVFYLPSHTRESQDDLKAEVRIMGLAKSLNITFIDGFSAAFWERSSVYEDALLRLDPPEDTHYNAQGNRLIAQTLAESPELQETSKLING
jgi:hypothetical protein